jgi:hypothetical protein
MTDRPEPNTNAHDIYQRLQVQMSRAGLRIDSDGCAKLARTIQKHGHQSDEAARLANALGLDPKWLPYQRVKRRRSSR